jgi:hypothetical protein
MDAPTNPPKERDAATQDEFRKALRRILESNTMRSRARLREFLQYVCEEALNGHKSDIKEQAIGVAVFGRKPDYPVHEDTIVRVSARQLRQKLDEYYRGEGKDDEVFVEIPKGSYVPHCYRRDVTPVTFQLSEEQPALVRQPDHHKSLFGSARVAWTVVGCMLVVCAALLVVAATGSIRNLSASAGTMTLLGRLTANGARVSIVCGDGVVQVFKELTGEAPTLDAYEAREYLHDDRLPDVVGRDNKVWETLKHRKLLATGSMHMTVSLVQNLPSDRVTVRHPMDVSVRDFYDGSAILLSGPFANPWVKLFEERLNYRIEQTSDTDVYIRNVMPHPGEPAAYHQHADNGKRKTYARLALLPNLAGTGEVLLIGGPSIALMEQMGKAAANPDFLTELLGHFGLQEPHELPYCEILMEVVQMAGAPIESRIVAIRAIADLAESSRYRGGFPHAIAGVRKGKP